MRRHSYRAVAVDTLHADCPAWVCVCVWNFALYCLLVVACTVYWLLLLLLLLLSVIV